MFSALADAAFLPAIIPREYLVAANSSLSTSSAVARIAGPGIAGVLIQLLTAPLAVLVDAFTFLVSALSVVLIRTPESALPSAERPPNVWIEIVEGMRPLVSDPFLRALQFAATTFDLFWNALYVVYFLYVTRELGLQPGAIGLILGVGSAGALLGSLGASWAARRFRLGPTFVGTQILMGLGGLLIPFALWLPTRALLLLVCAELVQSFAATINGINRNSLVQAVTPDRLRGRVNASNTFIGLGAATAGTLLGCVLGEWIGVPATITIGASGSMFAFVWLMFSPVATLREFPPSMDSAVGDGNITEQ